MTWGTREQANEVDSADVAFYATEQGAGKCMITAKSRNQKQSYFDNNVNFCNIYNGLRIATRDSGIDFNLQGIKNINCQWFLTQDVYQKCDRW